MEVKQFWIEEDDYSKPHRFVFESDHLATVQALQARIVELEEAIRWNDVNESQPELKDDGVLIHFENGSIETVHIEDFFKPITAGIIDGVQQYTKWYLHHNPKPLHWMSLPKEPK